MVVRIKKIIKFLFIPIFLIFASVNYGCSPASVLATGGGSAMVVAEGERSLGTVVDDATIKVNIAAKFLNAENNLFININTSVLEGRILLTGLVDNQEIRIDAVRLVWEVEGVKEVIFCIQEFCSNIYFNCSIVNNRTKRSFPFCYNHCASTTSCKDTCW